jgi:O-antigen/teichoic acid export membrane protein
MSQGQDGIATAASAPTDTRRRLIRDRAASGAAALGARGAVVMVAGVGVNLALARMLSPRDFGYVALGTALIVVGQYLSIGGLGVALIRKPGVPERRELAAVQGVQLAVAAFFVLVGVLLAFVGERAGQVAAVMCASIPLVLLRLPSSISLERELLFRTIAFVEILESAAYYAWALITVAAGFGVWGLASAAIARALVGTVTMIRAAPVGYVAPTWDWRLVRPLLGFGLKFQGASAASMGRDYGLTAGVGAVAGLASLGIWSFAYRILQIPLLLSRSLLRVSYPALARMREAGESVDLVIERSTGVVAAGVAILGVGIVAGAPAAIPALAGERWSDAASILLWGTLGYMIWIPVSVTAAGYLLAAGRAGLILVVNVLEAVALLGVTLALLPTLGVEAIGLGWIAVGLVDLIILSPPIRRETGATMPANLAPTLALAAGSGGIGWAIAETGSHTVPTALLAAVVAEVLLLGGLWLFDRELIRRTVSLARLGLGGALGWPGEEPLPETDLVESSSPEPSPSLRSLRKPSGWREERRRSLR